MECKRYKSWCVYVSGGRDTGRRVYTLALSVPLPTQKEDPRPIRNYANSNRRFSEESQNEHQQQTLQ